MEKSFCVFEGAPFKPFKHTMTFFRKMFLNFFKTIMKNEFDTNSRFFCHKNRHVIKRKKIFYLNVFKLQRFSKVLSNVGGNALFWRGH